MYGAEQENIHIKQNSIFVFDCPQTGLDMCCDLNHTHIQLRGQGPGGSRTAAAAMYPKALCASILASIAAMRTTPQDGRIMPSHTFDAPARFEAMSKLDQVLHRLQDLRGAAQKLGYGDLFKELVDPWIDQEARCGRVAKPSNSIAASVPSTTGPARAQAHPLGVPDDDAAEAFAADNEVETAEKDARAPAEEVEAAENDARAPAAEQPAPAGETVADDELGQQSASPEAVPKELEDLFK